MLTEEENRKKSRTYVARLHALGITTAKRRTSDKRHTSAAVAGDVGRADGVPERTNGEWISREANDRRILGMDRQRPSSPAKPVVKHAAGTLVVGVPLADGTVKQVTLSARELAMLAKTNTPPFAYAKKKLEYMPGGAR